MDLKQATFYIAKASGLFVHQIRDSVINCYRDSNGDLVFINNICQCNLDNCLRCLPSMHLNHHTTPHDNCRACLKLRSIFYAQRQLLKEFHALFPKTSQPVREDTCIGIYDYTFGRQRKYSCLFGGAPNTTHPGMRLLSCVAYV